MSESGLDREKVYFPLDSKAVHSIARLPELYLGADNLISLYRDTDTPGSANPV